MIFVFGNGLSVGFDSRLATATITQRVLASLGDTYAEALRELAELGNPEDPDTVPVMGWCGGAPGCALTRTRALGALAGRPGGCPSPDWYETASRSYAYSAWTDLELIANGGGEIGDKCSPNVIGAAGWGAQVWDNHLADMYLYNSSTGGYDYYNVQKEFSNSAFYA